jgi:hypothetical protein
MDNIKDKCEICGEKNNLCNNQPPIMSNEMICVLITMIKTTPNDSELGMKIRKMYYEL